MIFIEPLSVKDDEFRHCLSRIVCTAVFALAVLVMADGCRSEAERRQSETVFFLKEVLYILEHSGGDTDVAIAELDKFVEKNGERLQEIHRKKLRILQEMTPEEREQFTKNAIEQSRSVTKQIGTVYRTFPDPSRIFRKLRKVLKPVSAP